MMMKTEQTSISMDMDMDMDMEAREVKYNSNKKNLVKYLQRALTFHNNTHFSPGRKPQPRPSDEYKNRALMSLVPIKATDHNSNKKGREKEKEGRSGGFGSDVEEPRSPKVSCIGQIKQKKKKKLDQLKREKSKNLERLESKPVDKGAKKNPNSGFGNIFRRKSKPRAVEEMKRFSSGSDAFANFDWTKQQVGSVDRECYSDDEEQRRRDWDDEDDDDDDEGEDEGGRNDVMIPFSAPMMIGGGVQLEPRKEICLWKKRNMPPPKPLQLNTFSSR